MILGAPDVVPHQDMKNPAFDPPDDPDEYAYGDLPYACDAPYSRDIATFKGPTRVVGRLPDLTKAQRQALAICSAARDRGERIESRKVDRLRRVFRPLDPVLAQVHGREPVQHVRQL